MIQTGETVYGQQGQAYILKERKGAGGEGTVYLTDQKSIAAKIYHNPTEVQERKIRCMIRRKIPTKTESGVSLIAWPQDLLYQNGKFVGYTMPLIEGGKPLFILYRDKPTREFFKDYNWTKSLCVAMNLAHLVSVIHDQDCVVGDMNPGNIIVHPNGLVSILDVDSFDITDPETGEHFKCGVGIADYLPPELQHRKSLKDESSKFTKNTDEFALAIHIFSILFHYHPFLARLMAEYHESTDVNQIDKNIVNGICPFIREIQNIAIPVGAPSLELLNEDLQADFRYTFGYTAENCIERKTHRTSAKTWYEHLKTFYHGKGTELVPCDKNKEHYRRKDHDCELCKAKEPVPKPVPSKPEPVPSVAKTEKNSDFERFAEEADKILKYGIGFGIFAFFVLFAMGAFDWSTGAQWIIVGFFVAYGWTIAKMYTSAKPVRASFLCVNTKPDDITTNDLVVKSTNRVYFHFRISCKQSNIKSALYYECGYSGKPTETKKYHELISDGYNGWICLSNQDGSFLSGDIICTLHDGNKTFLASKTIKAVQ